MMSMGKILYAEHNGVHVLKFVGNVRLTLGPTIAAFLDQLKQVGNFKAIVLDMSETEAIDSTALGLVAKIAICTKESFDCAPSIISPNQDITRVLTSMAMDQVCILISDSVVDSNGLLELPREVVSEDALREQVLEAHKTLMSLNAHNRDSFKDLVTALEHEREGFGQFAKTG